MKNKNYDFGGWATKNDLLCADGRTIRKNAFKDDDGRTVPLVWQHNHEDPTRVLGHVLLENEDEGVYAYGTFNNTDIAQHVKELVRHGDINSLSIYANKLKQRDGDVLHGVIREVSVVLAGANPGAMIEFPIMEHGEESESEAIIWSGDFELELGDGMRLSHAEGEGDGKSEGGKEGGKESDAKDEGKDSKSGEKKEESKDDKSEKKDEKKDESEKTVKDVVDGLNKEQRSVLEFLIGKAVGGDDDEDDDDDDDVSHADDDEDEGDGRTVADVLDTLTDEQRKVFEFLIAQAIESAGEEDDEDDEEGVSHSINDEGEDETMKKNVFENDQMVDQEANTLTHAQIDTIVKDAKRLGSMKQSVLEHSAEYGIDQIDYIMPEYREATGNGAPQFIKRDMKWVTKVINGVHHIPFSKFKTTFADITEDEARARGYITGNRKKEEVFGLLRRTTDATTVYKKQKMDRDNVIEITGFDVIAWLKGEMRMMLDEELARAFLVGDGRDASSEDKINELNIRPILRDDSLFVIRQTMDLSGDVNWADALVDATTYAWETYQGSGNCAAFMTRRSHSKMKLLRDKIGHRIYKTDAEIASALGVGEIVFVPQMGEATSVRVDAQTGKTYKPAVIIVDLDDYTVGADKGGAINMFDDFDIDYNQMKYLIETRCSGALVKPYSAIVIEEEVNPQ